MKARKLYLFKGVTLPDGCEDIVFDSFVTITKENPTEVAGERGFRVVQENIDEAVLNAITKIGDAFKAENNIGKLCMLHLVAVYLTKAAGEEYFSTNGEWIWWDESKQQHVKAID